MKADQRRISEDCEISRAGGVILPIHLNSDPKLYVRSNGEPIPFRIPVQPEAAFPMLANGPQHLLMIAQGLLAETCLSGVNGLNLLYKLAG